MLSTRHTVLKSSLKPAMSFMKIENAAYIHICCTHHLKLTSPTSKLLKNYRRNVFSTEPLIRYESSSSGTPTTTNNQSSTGLESIPEPPTPLPEFTQSAVEGFAGDPSFESLGLGGWSPVGMVQNCLEFLHVSCGLPWWGSIVCGTIVIRLLMFPLVVIAQRNAARLNNNLPQVQYLQNKTTIARQRGDKIEAARYSAELMKFMNEKNVNPIKNMLPPICQAPIFISVFMGLREMASLPVESLKTGGVLWFVDLTVPDQYYLLPVITSATLYCTLKLGIDGGQPTRNLIIMKYVMLGLPVIVIPFTLNFQGVMLTYWCTSNFVSLAQVGFLKIPAVRDYFKIEKIIQHNTKNLAIEDKGFVNNIKESWTNMKITSELEQRERADKMAFMQAGRAPIQKTYKYDPTKVNQPIQAKKRT